MILYLLLPKRRIALTVTSCSTQKMSHQRDKKQDQEDEKQDLRYPCRGHCNSGKAEQRCKNRDDEKPQCPTKHKNLLNFLNWNVPEGELRETPYF
ncbi:MAG: hypothetical protein PVS2B2_13120 [Candidatus Acidiferrum sp.]